MTDSSYNEQATEHKLITHLFDTQPDSVVWFIPVFDHSISSVPVDFEVGYCNTAACMILKASKQQVIGSGLKHSPLMDETSRLHIFTQCLEVWTTGVHQEFTYYSEGLAKHFHVQRSKLQNGILAITRDHTAFVKNTEEKERQARLLNQVVENSSSGISLYEAIRDKAGRITDFRLRLANKKSAEITAFPLEDLYKYSAKELMVIRGQPKFFEIVKKVVETGEAIETEFFSSAREQWLAFSIKKFDDGYILNYVDITLTKGLEKKAKDQADMLNGILNASITGFITIEAIYSPSGRIEDFKFILLNAAAEKLLGFKEADKNKSYLTLFPAAKTNGFFDMYVNALVTGEPISKEFFYKGDGYNGWYFISVSKVNDRTLVQSCSDITHTREHKE